MTGTVANSAASRAAPSFGWRMTIASAYPLTTRIVSASVSPFAIEQASTLLTEMEVPPRRAMADSKDIRVRVLGFKKEDGKDFAVKGVCIVFFLPDLLCVIQQAIDCAAVKIPDGYDVMRGHSSRASLLSGSYAHPDLKYLSSRKGLSPVRGIGKNVFDRNDIIRLLPILFRKLRLFLAGT